MTTRRAGSSVLRFSSVFHSVDSQQTHRSGICRYVSRTAYSAESARSVSPSVSLACDRSESWKRPVVSNVSRRHHCVVPLPVYPTSAAGRFASLSDDCLSPEHLSQFDDCQDVLGPDSLPSSYADTRNFVWQRWGRVPHNMAHSASRGRDRSAGIPFLETMPSQRPQDTSSGSNRHTTSYRTR